MKDKIGVAIICVLVATLIAEVHIVFLIEEDVDCPYPCEYPKADVYNCTDTISNTTWLEAHIYYGTITPDGYGFRMELVNETTGETVLVYEDTWCERV